jgi:SSS family solute:Na+ symporter
MTSVGVNVIVSLFTKPKPLSELTSVVYGVTPLPTEEPVPLYKNEWFWTAIAIVIFFALNIYFW